MLPRIPILSAQMRGVSVVFRVAKRVGVGGAETAKLLDSS